MNPKVSRAIELLQSEAIFAEHQQTVLTSVRTNSAKKQTATRRRVVFGSIPAVGMLAAVGFFAFFPRNNQDQVFAQAIRNATQITKVHQWVEQDGKKIFENWLDGDKFAMRMYYGDKVDHDYRTDGKNLSYYFGGSHAWTGENVKPYAYTEKISKSLAPPVTAFVGMTPVQEAFPIKESMIMQLYKIRPTDKPAAVITEVVDGKELLVSTWPLPVMAGESNVKIYVDPAVPAVVRVDETENKTTRVWHFDYPNQVDPKNFEPTRYPGVIAYDKDIDRQRLKKSMQAGIATKTVEGVAVKLLAVVKEPRTNSLMVLWDGVVTNHQGDQVARIVGNPTVKDVTPSDLTTFKYSLERKDRRTYILDGNFAASGLLLQNKIGSAVTVQVPVLKADKSKPLYDRDKKLCGYYGKKIGMAEFKNVPVMTIGSFHSLGEW